MRFHDAAAVAAALPWERLLQALREAFAGETVAPTRHRHALPGSATLLLMPAWRADFLGVKIVTVHPGNGALGLDAVHSQYLLSEAATGRPVALIEGDALTARRTAAASALAASYLAVPDASRLLVVGAGRVAALLAGAHRSVRPIRQVRVWNRGVARRDALVAALLAEGFAAEAAGSLEEAVGWADIVSCATLATEPLVRGAWLRAGQHLDLVGAFTPAMREADAAAVARAAAYADTEAALGECGELAGGVALMGTLASLCRGSAVERGAEGITLFKSVGTALEDLAAAVVVADV